MKESLLGKTPDELREVALKVGLPAFAGKQLAGWLYGRRVKSFDEMTNISKVGRVRLAEEFDLGVVTPSSCQVSKDGTKKYLFPLGGGDAVEAVMMCLSNVISQHLRRGDKVRLDTWGLMKLEIESDKVDDPATFRANKHIRGVRLHFLPESEKGKPELYQDMTFEKERG